jgi:hypothetical protein
LRKAIPLLSIIVPRQLSADIRKTEVQLLSLEQLDETLRAAGLPVSSAETFRLDYRGSDPVEEATEAEYVADEDATKK